MEKHAKSSRNVLLRILIIGIIVAVILGIYYIKNGQKPVTDEPQGIPLHLASVNMEEIVSRNLPVIIDFGADECIPCKAMAPVLIKLNEEMQSKASIHFVDLWKNPDTPADFPIRVIPTQVFFMPDGSPYVPSDGILSNTKAGGFQMYTDKNTGEHLFTTHEGGLSEDDLRKILEDMGVSV